MSSRWFALALAIFLGACGGGDRTKSEDKVAGGDTVSTAPFDTVGLPYKTTDSTLAALDSTESVTPSVPWTAGIMDLPGKGQEMAVLASVRHAAHAGHDRVVFEFKPGARPAAHVEYVDRPVRHCGSGDVVPLAGQGWLWVKFTPAVAHTEEGHPTIADRARTLNLPVIKELKLTCDFEADVSWVAGVSSPNRYRALTLEDPPRVIIDVRH